MRMLQAMFFTLFHQSWIIILLTFLLAFTLVCGIFNNLKNWLITMFTLAGISDTAFPFPKCIYCQIKKLHDASWAWKEGSLLHAVIYHRMHCLREGCWGNVKVVKTGWRDFEDVKWMWNYSIVFSLCLCDCSSSGDWNLSSIS